MKYMNDFEIFEIALDSMRFKETFTNKIREVVRTFYDQYGSLNQTQVFRLTNHITLLYKEDAEELAERFMDVKNYGKPYNKASRYFRDKQ
jgi:hypothetical protein